VRAHNQKLRLELQKFAEFDPQIVVDMSTAFPSFFLCALPDFPTLLFFPLAQDTEG
jgi:hypothetical protein